LPILIPSPPRPTPFPYTTLFRSRVALGHTRLSILDLSPLGHQPMRSADGSLTMVFNGEVYNFAAIRGELQALGHRFRSSGDSERSEEHTSELQSLRHLVCRLLLE